MNYMEEYSIIWEDGTVTFYDKEGNVVTKKIHRK